MDWKSFALGILAGSVASSAATIGAGLWLYGRIRSYLVLFGLTASYARRDIGLPTPPADM